MWGSELPELVGTRLRLRMLTRADAQGILSVFGDPEVIRYWSSSQLKDLDEAGELIDRIHGLFERCELFQWGIHSRELGQIVGTCTLQHVDTTHKRAEVGIALGSPSWGHGLGPEALGLLIDFVFDELELHRLEADVDPNNARSIAMFERLGFQREGYLRERWHLLGEIQDSVLFGLLKHEWRRTV